MPKFRRLAIAVASVIAAFAPLLVPALVPAAQAQFGLDETVDVINEGQSGVIYDPAATPESIIGRIIKYALQFVGVLFFILMLYAGFKWMTARGNPKDAEAAREIIMAAVIGLVIVAAAYAITSFVLVNVSQ